MFFQKGQAYIYSMIFCGVGKRKEEILLTKLLGVLFYQTVVLVDSTNWGMFQTGLYLGCGLGWGFLSLGTSDILSQVIIRSGAALCLTKCLVASLASVYLITVARPTSTCYDNRKCFQMLPKAPLPICPWLRTTELGKFWSLPGSFRWTS